jgi:uncharacterized protein YbjQ (UPF0145 family)
MAQASDYPRGLRDDPWFLSLADDEKGSYADAYRKTFAGALDELEDAAEKAGEDAVEAVRQVRARWRKVTTRSLAEWIRRHW